ncbi:hypothetical protein ABZV91_18860 [Nocardia sp. NPDC004568]|uniref:hypothetical protein n=1 Tax=Nocardia sp. NPDC004568 TaxID=3154551 RepID=UPI0033B715D4
MDVGDAAAMASAGVSVVALGTAIYAATNAVKSLKWEQQSAESARRSAEAAERANLLTERALLTGRPTPMAAGSTGETVTWEVEHPGGHRYVLRNTGDVMAEHVSIDASQIVTIARGLPTDAVVRPGEGLDFMMVATWGAPLPNQIYVEWGDPDNPSRVAVPITS